MNKNEKLIMGFLAGGILIFLGLSTVLLFSKNQQKTTNEGIPSTVMPTTPLNPTAYPTIAQVVNATVQLHTRQFVPDSVQIKAGGFVSFINIDQNDMTIEPNTSQNAILNIGTLKPGEHKEVTFKAVGTYSYRNKNKPSETGIIIVQ